MATQPSSASSTTEQISWASISIIWSDIKDSSFLGENNQLKWKLEIIIITNDLIKGHKRPDK